MDEIQEVFEETKTDLTLEEFVEKTEDKHEKMGKIVDKESAALLVAQEVSDSSIQNIEDVTLDDDTVQIIGKITRKSEVKTFSQNSNGAKSDEEEEDSDSENEEDTGRVQNAYVTDETDTIKIAFWGKKALATDENYDIGDQVRVEGKPTENYGNLELNGKDIQPEQDIDIDIDVGGTKPIGEVDSSDKSITVKGKVLNKSSVNTFSRNDGSEGKVANIFIGDKSGDIRVTLWDETTELIEKVSTGDVVKVKNVDVTLKTEDKSFTPGSTDQLILNVNTSESITTISEEIEYSPDGTPVEDLSAGDVVTIHGDITQIDDPNTFNRDDGSEGVVQNIKIRDKENGDSITGVLWGDKILAPEHSHTEVILINTELKDGFEDELEANMTGYTMAIYTPEEDSHDTESNESKYTTDEESSPSSEENEETSASEDSVTESADTENKSEVQESSTDQEDTATTLNEKSTSDHDQDDDNADNIKVTGVVLEKGDTVKIDTSDSSELIIPPEGENLRLGQEITVRGHRNDDGVIEANDVF